MSWVSGPYGPPGADADAEAAAAAERFQRMRFWGHITAGSIPVGGFRSLRRVY